MRILFISGELIGSGLCHQFIREGNEVRLYIHKKEWQKCLRGFLETTNDWKRDLTWVGKDGLIVFDDIIFGAEQDRLRKEGYRVIGGSKMGDALELDRRHFQEIAAEYGVETLPSYNFEHAEEAARFVRQNRGRWVIKQNTHISAFNFIGRSKDASDVLRVLKRYQRLRISPVHLQQFAEGIEVGVARYFNGNDWVGPIEINHEHKMLQEGDVGPLTPEMGTVLWYTEKNVRLFKEVLAPLAPYLRKIDFRGDIDINCIVSETQAYPLEATPRFGTPSTEIQVALHTSPWSDFLSAVADKKQYKLEYRNEYGIAVSIVVPPFPYPPTNDRKGKSVPILFENSLVEEDFSHIHCEEVSKDGESYEWAGEYGWVLHVTAHAKTIKEARQLVYGRVEKIQIPGSYYRKDIGERVAGHDLRQLAEWGWI